MTKKYMSMNNLQHQKGDIERLKPYFCIGRGN